MSPDYIQLDALIFPKSQIAWMCSEGTRGSVLAKVASNVGKPRLRRYFANMLNLESFTASDLQRIKVHVSAQMMNAKGEMALEISFPHGINTG